MSDSCAVKTEWTPEGRKRCGITATHAVVDDRGSVHGFVCDGHANVAHGAYHEMQYVSEYMREIEGAAWSASRGSRYLTMSVVSLYCEVCRQRLPTNRYPGAKCPECMRSTMVADAMNRQAEAVVKLQEILERQRSNEIIMARENTDTKTTGLIDRATATATALGADKMALRAAARQILKAVKQPLAAGLATRLKGNKPREFTRSIAAFLDTPLGESALSLCLGGVVRVFPGVPEAYRDSLSEEFTVSGGANALDFVADIFMGPIRDALAGGVALLAAPSALTQGGFHVEPVKDAAHESVK